MTQTPKRKPVAFSGEGSAIDNYLSPNPTGTTDGKKWEAFDIKNKKHKYILSLLHQLGWTKEVNGRTVGNMENLAHWLKTKSPIQKPLTEQTEAELSKVIFAFEKTVKHFFS